MALKDLTDEALQKIVAAFTNTSNLVPINQAAKSGSFENTLFSCHIRPYRTDVVAATRRMIDFDQRIFQLDPPTDLVEYDALLGLIQMDEPSSSAAVIQLVQQLGLEICTHTELLAAIVHPDDPLLGAPVVPLATSLTDAESRVLYVRYNSFYRSERTLFLEHEDTQSDSFNAHCEEVRLHPDKYVGYQPKRRLPGWPAAYRFLVKAKSHH